MTRFGNSSNSNSLVVGLGTAGTDSKPWLKHVLLFLLLVLATINSTHAHSLDAVREICRPEVAQFRKKIAALTKENVILRRQKDIELTTSAGHSTTTTKKKFVHEKTVPMPSASIQHDSIVGLDKKPDADDNGVNKGSYDDVTVANKFLANRRQLVYSSSSLYEQVVARCFSSTGEPDTGASCVGPTSSGQGVQTQGNNWNVERNNPDIVYLSLNDGIIPDGSEYRVRFTLKALTWKTASATLFSIPNMVQIDANDWSSAVKTHCGGDDKTTLNYMLDVTKQGWYLYCQGEVLPGNRVQNPDFNVATTSQLLYHQGRSFNLGYTYGIASVFFGWHSSLTDGSSYCRFTGIWSDVVVSLLSEVCPAGTYAPTGTAACLPLPKCDFSDKVSGDHIVPGTTGCKLSQMITVNGIMKVVGEGNVLRELAAVGGTPDMSNPKRHFYVPNLSSLILKDLRMTGGKVLATKTLSTESFWGGSILTEYGSHLNVTSVKFDGCIDTCARYGGCKFFSILIFK